MKLLLACLTVGGIIGFVVGHRASGGQGTEIGTSWQSPPNPRSLIIAPSLATPEPTATPEATPMPAPPTATPSPTAVPTATATPAPPTAAPVTCKFKDCRKQEFIEGWVDGGRRNTVRADALVACESTWRLDPPGFFLGLAQFHPDTWDTVAGRTGLDDYRNPYHQGYNAATWATLVDNPGGTAGWPICWWAGS